MTRLFPRQFGLAGAAVVLMASLAFASGAASDHRLMVAAATSSIEEADGKATVKFVVEVANQDEAAITGLLVVFSKDFQVSVGDVAANAKATSAPQQATFDVSSALTKSLAVPVTLRFSVDGVAAEMPWVLNLGRIQ